MKNTFAVSMTLLLALTLGGSFAAYNIATKPHHEESHSEEGAAVPSEEAPSANSTTTGAAGPAGAQGDAVAANEGGTQGGENGAVAASGEQTTPETPAASTEGTQADSTPGEEGATGQEPTETAAAAEPQGDVAAGEKLYASSNCAACHGANGQGQIGPSLVGADGPKNWTLAQFTTALREGKTPDRELGAVMPRFNETQLTDSDIANMQAFIKTLN
ncbi:c-type cytochrome [Deinococcus seoulensis]|uniref:C-type cytochrome n=2 Tax=Deinococcus TaxID=1298 RepID=A0ABQ2RQP4_9DEIO|nr:MULTISPECIES: cytochrome c [Deinococcus]GGR46996.1 c-type cytochrome [Deinococcus seoulensis]GGS15368.1 c-type cytochrome [Deinococcus knuensis]